MADEQPPSACARSSRSFLRVAVVQDGARLHYAVPLALFRAGVLGLMFSEAFLSSDSFLRQILEHSPLRLPIGLRGLLERRCDEIDAHLARTNFSLVLRQQWQRRRIASDEAFYQWSAAAAGRWIARHGFDDCNTLFGFVRNIDPLLLETARRQGLRTVVDQIIAPAQIEAAQAEQQVARWPNWSRSAAIPDLARLDQIERQSWASASRITCASDYVRDGLIAQGVERQKIAVNPYPADAAQFSVADRASRHGPITVGFVGSVSLRKGAPYFLQVARRLASTDLRFVMVGPIELSDLAQKEVSSAVHLTGRVPRADIANWLAKFDVFFFPSTCEGSAGSVMEAMASGLPIVTSPSSGSIVREGIEGFVRNCDDIEGFAHCIEQLAHDDALRHQMAAASRESAQANTIARFGARLLESLAQL